VLCGCCIKASSQLVVYYIHVNMNSLQLFFSALFYVLFAITLCNAQKGKIDPNGMLYPPICICVCVCVFVCILVSCITVCVCVFAIPVTIIIWEL
jgi:hypothetical protein